jgi:hypothetical protein
MHAGEQESTYVINGADYLRYWFVVKNEYGKSAAHGRFLLVGGVYFGVEYLNTSVNIINSDQDIAAVIYDDYSYYK